MIIVRQIIFSLTMFFLLGVFLSLSLFAQNAQFSAGEPGGSVENPVGSCDSRKGCRALKKACLKLKGHTFKPTNGGGICDDGKSHSEPKKGMNKFAAKGTKVKDAKCFSVALCNELLNTCQGKFVRKMPYYGVCKD